MRYPSRRQYSTPRSGQDAGFIAGDFNNVVDQTNDLLAYGAFDWAITDREAKQAFGPLKVSPLKTESVQCSLYNLARRS